MNCLKPPPVCGLTGKGDAVPNWCQNVVVFTAPADDCRAFRELMRADAGAFDFHAVEPMPPELMQCNLSDETAYQLKYGEWESEPWWGATNYPSREAALQAARHPENAGRWRPPIVCANPFLNVVEWVAGEPRTFDAAADMAHANVLNHGHAFWHGWAKDHWGTKWNVGAGDARWKSEPGAERVEFETAWAPPLPVLERLAVRFTGAEIRLDYLEPEGGFQGTAVFVGGALTHHTNSTITPPEEGGTATA